MNDTLVNGVLLTVRIRRQKTVGDIVGVLCDYHYIYGPDRSHLTASWNSMLRDGIVELANGRNGRMERVAKAMLDDMTEYSTYECYDADAVIESIIDAGLRAYERHKRLTFKAKLAGDTNTYYGW